MPITSPFVADSMSFHDLPGKNPVLKLQEGQTLSLALAHLTSAPPTFETFDGVLVWHDSFVAQALFANPRMRPVSTRRDAVIIDGSTALVFGLQNTPKGMTLQRMRILRDHGVRIMSLAYDDANEYGHGFVNGNVGLTLRGEELITWMAECGIILDLSHAGHKTARGALAFIQSAQLRMHPMLSHSGCFSVFPHKRNVPDDILEDVAGMEGYIGIPLITFLLGPKDCEYLAAFKKHLAHAISVMGEDKVGIGSDSTYRDMTIEEAFEHYQKMNKELGAEEKFGAYFPDRPPELIENGSRLLDVLMKNGCVEERNIQGVYGRNFREFLYRALPK